MITRRITWSYGGGVQSVAIAVLVAQGKLPTPEAIVFADTGREASETWEYTNKHMTPLLATVGVEITVAPHTLAKWDLYSRKGDLLLPVFTANGKLSTYCSREWKGLVVQRQLRAMGFGPQKPVTTWLGFSLDEIHRVKEQSLKWQKIAWPLLFDLCPALTRKDCEKVILKAGLPLPPRSSCYMCPHRSNAQWLHLQRTNPVEFELACQIDEDVRRNDIEKGHSGVYLHRDLKPLREIDLNTQQAEPEHPLLFECSTAGCWT